MGISHTPLYLRRINMYSLTTSAHLLNFFNINDKDLNYLHEIFDESYNQSIFRDIVYVTSDIDIRFALGSSESSKPKIIKALLLDLYIIRNEVPDYDFFNCMKDYIPDVINQLSELPNDDTFMEAYGKYIKSNKKEWSTYNKLYNMDFVMVCYDYNKFIFVDDIESQLFGACIIGFKWVAPDSILIMCSSKETPVYITKFIWDILDTISRLDKNHDVRVNYHSCTLNKKNASYKVVTRNAVNECNLDSDTLKESVYNFILERYNLCMGLLK